MNAVSKVGLGLALVMLSAGPLAAASYNGTIGLAQVSEINGSETARFYVAASGLSLYATGVEQDLLRDALMHKASVSVSYTTMTCPPGIVGTCGLVTMVTVNAFNVP